VPPAFLTADRLHLSHLIPVQDYRDTNPSYLLVKKSLPAIVPFANPKYKWQKQPIRFVKETWRKREAEECAGQAESRKPLMFPQKRPSQADPCAWMPAVRLKNNDQ
jgi:hypothetical protein